MVHFFLESGTTVGLQKPIPLSSAVKPEPNEKSTLSI
jgi:hypothetical protein